MSIQAMVWVFEHSGSEGSDRLVLLAIANHADSEAVVAWPSVDRIAEEARVSRRTVFRSLERLVEIGELEITRSGGRGHTNTYRMTLDATRNGDSLTPLPGSETVSTTTEKVPPVSPFPRPETVTSVHERVSTTTRKGDTGGTQNRQEPSEPSLSAACRVCGAPAAAGSGRCPDCTTDTDNPWRPPPTATTPPLPQPAPPTRDDYRPPNDHEKATGLDGLTRVWSALHETDLRAHQRRAAAATKDGGDET